MALFEQPYGSVPNGTTHDAITAPTGQTYAGDVLNYPVQSGQLTAITGRTFVELLDVEVTPFVTNLGTIQDYEVVVQYDSPVDSDFIFKFGGDDNANCYAAQIRRQSIEPAVALWKLTAGVPTFLGLTILGINPPISRTVVVRHEPAGVTLDFGGSAESFIADTSYPDPANKKLYWFIGTVAAAGTGVHATSIKQVAPNTVKPIIRNLSPTPYKWAVGETPYVPPNVVADDDLDGIITDKLVEGGDTVDPLTKGSYFRTYNVTDSAGNAADQFSLEVRVQDPINIPKDYDPDNYTLTVDIIASNCTTSQDIGTLDITLDIDGDVNVTLDDNLMSSSGDLLNSGSFSSTLEDNALVSSGTLIYVGSLSETLEDNTSTVSGTIVLNGTVNVTLDDNVMEANDLFDIDGTINTTLQDNSSNASGNLTYSGSMATTLEDNTSSSSGTYTLVGTLTSDLDDNTLASNGTFTLQGTLTTTLEDHTIVSNDFVNVTGTVGVVLEDMALEASGEVFLGGSLNSVLDDIDSTSLGTVKISGSLSEVLQNNMMITPSTKTIVQVIPYKIFINPRI